MLSSAHLERAPHWFGRKVARLPSTGVLLFATDLQGNFEDYEALKNIYFEEKRSGREPTLMLCGDLVHGPGPRLANEADWPDYLGTFYRDRSVDLVLDFMELCRHEQAFSLLGNHEHAHIGGPVVSKFHHDEAAVLEEQLGANVEQVRAFFASLPLVAAAECGVVFSHGAPRATEPDEASFERLHYDGYGKVAVGDMFDIDTLGSLLWSRAAAPEHARALLSALLPGHGGLGVAAYGHDVVREGFEKVGDNQLCLSTSFGVENPNKYYLRLDLAKRYDGVSALRLGAELRRLYPNA